MAEYSREDASTAERVMRQCVDRAGEGIEVPADLVVSDVEADTDLFLSELDLVRRVGSGMPCVVIGDDVVPISLSAILPPFPGTQSRRFFRYPFIEEVYYYYLRELHERP